MSDTFAPHHCVGPMGSEFWQLSAPPEIVPVLAEEIDWNRFGRRVMIDAAEGIILWMNPSGPHEDYADAAGKTVEAAAQILGELAKAKLGTRWKRSEDPKNTGLEADASFYIGKNAERWRAARKAGAAALAAFEAATPPDLVIEVEVSKFAGGKPRRYAALGIPEMWRVDRRSEDRAVKVEILALQAPGGPRQADESLSLPGLKAALLPEAFELAVDVRHEDLKELLEAALVRTPKL